jgi:hypothetical protein
MRVTSDQVKKFWVYMCRKYKCRVIDKNSAEEMRIVAWALDAMGVQNKKVFMTKFTTTLGDRIYVPFEIARMPACGSVQTK